MMLNCRLTVEKNLTTSKTDTKNSNRTVDRSYLNNYKIKSTCDKCLVNLHIRHKKPNFLNQLDLSAIELTYLRRKEHTFVQTLNHNPQNREVVNSDENGTTVSGGCNGEPIS